GRGSHAGRAPRGGAAGPGRSAAPLRVLGRRRAPGGGRRAARAVPGGNDVSVNDDPVPSPDLAALRRENEALLRELENSYAQLAAVLQVSQDETRIAYSELQEKLVVQEKKLVELAFLGGAVEALFEERDAEVLRRLVLDKTGLLVPFDLGLLVLLPDLDQGLQRERDVVREAPADPARQEM